MHLACVLYQGCKLTAAASRQLPVAKQDHCISQTLSHHPTAGMHAREPPERAKAPRGGGGNKGEPEESPGAVRQFGHNDGSTHPLDATDLALSRPARPLFCQIIRVRGHLKSLLLDCYRIDILPGARFGAYRAGQDDAFRRRLEPGLCLISRPLAIACFI